MPKQRSRWFEWQKRRWAQSLSPTEATMYGARPKPDPEPDHFVDDDGTLYCDHGCRSIDEHRARSPA